MHSFVQLTRYPPHPVPFLFLNCERSSAPGGERLYDTEGVALCYESGDKLFCKFCQHTIDWTRKNMCCDHLKSKAHVKNKEKHRVGQSLFKQPLLVEAHQQIQDENSFRTLWPCAPSLTSNIEKLRKLRPFLVKNCKQGGAFPENESGLHQTYQPDIQGGSERSDAQQCPCNLSLPCHQSGG
uniref:U1-type domain-containing protein n=1 Tax=Salmo trutta TaxID=8032 RepID=A0A673WX60_SALTR